MDDSPPDPAAILGAAVREQRQRLGLAQAVLADLAGVGVAFLYDLERGKPTLRIDKVLSVLDALGLGLSIGVSDQLMRSQLGAKPSPAGDDAPGDAR